jgi:hypothetical protein
VNRKNVVSLGFSTHLGWVCVTAVRSRQREITSVRTFRLETSPPGDREVLEPYHVAGGFDGLQRIPPPTDPAASVARGLDGQRRTTAKNLKLLTRSLEDLNVGVCAAGLFVGRGRQAPTLEKILASHAQIHVAEGNAVRDSVRQACRGLDIPVVAIDKRLLFDVAQQHLELDERSAMNLLTRVKPDNAGGWRKEEKRCALAALIAAKQQQG